MNIHTVTITKSAFWYLMNNKEYTAYLRWCNHIGPSRVDKAERAGIDCITLDQCYPLDLSSITCVFCGSNEIKDWGTFDGKTETACLVCGAIFNREG